VWIKSEWTAIADREGRMPCREEAMRHLEAGGTAGHSERLGPVATARYHDVARDMAHVGSNEQERI
jgi:hypothetical protein